MAREFGVYRITCLATGHSYIGQTISPFPQRWRQHRRHLESWKHRNRSLQQDWLRFGEMAFEFAVVEAFHCSDTMGMKDLYDVIPHRECYWIAQYRKAGHCYNSPLGRTRCTDCGGYTVPSRAMHCRCQKSSRLYSEPPDE